jgi:RimJ/RimL family protein N-acetyltransferase
VSDPVSQIRLEPFAQTHVDAVAQLLTDPDVLRFTRVPVPVPEGFAQTWLDRYDAGRADGTREGFAIVDASSGAFFGLALAAEIDRDGRTAELGYVVAPEQRGRGIATAALEELTRWAFAALHLLRLELRIEADNPGSKVVAVRCGYVLEGTLRSAHIKQGLRGDVELWSRLATDPAP